MVSCGKAVGGRGHMSGHARNSKASDCLSRDELQAAGSASKNPEAQGMYRDPVRPSGASVKPRTKATRAMMMQNSAHLDLAERPVKHTLMRSCMMKFDCYQPKNRLQILGIWPS